MKISNIPEDLKRYKDLIKLFLKYRNNDVVKEHGNEAELLEDSEATKTSGDKVSELPDDLEKLGPTYIKLGQFLSTRSDMIAPQYMEALTRLQDNVAAFPFEEVQEIITKELGVRFSKAFKLFDPVPVAAASIGQVHTAVLNDDRQVIVKVQRPEIRQQIIEDLNVMEKVAEFLEKHSEYGKNVMLKTSLDEFRKVILRELDFKNEVQNLKTLGENLRDFELLIVPAPIEDYSTSRIITMDYIRGKKITSVSPLRMMEVDGKLLAEELFKAYLKQIIIDGFYHCDPHPGNVFLTDDNRVALLDLGMVAYISEDMQKDLLQLLMAISDGRSNEAATYAIQIGIKRPNFNEQRFRKGISEVVARQHNTMSLEQIETGRLVLELTKISGENGIHVPDELTMLGKTLLNLDKIGRTLDPHFDPNDSIRRNAKDLMRQKLLKSAVSKKPYEVLLEAKEFFEKLPSRVNHILDSLADNKFTFKVKAIDEQYLMGGIQKIANRITLGLIVAALIVGAALMMRIETNFTILGYPGLAMVFFLIAVAGGLALAISILIKDEKARKKSESPLFPE
jgi:ubiquinone biosynthesis protein